MPPSSSVAPTPSSSFGDLPVASMRSKIVEKIRDNRITLIVGEAGCGKSSQVPQFLLDENMGPIVCTQPRRFAVVAVAQMVAKSRNCEIGEEIGYHIGQSRVFSEKSKIIFKTAGVLLEEMRDKGANSFNCKVLILDEVHERSVESDLVLVCVKQFLRKKKDLRVVLMSATADISRYREYFSDLGKDERINVLAIPSTGQHAIFQRKVLYLEQVTKLLGIKSDDCSQIYCSGGSPDSAVAEFKAHLHRLIHDLIIHIHKNEQDIEKSILVFLPTYFLLEQQWFLLKPFSSCFKVHILHSSIDIQQALKAMKISKSLRKVILATNIAESSVTIPKVGYVIDSCRSLQVFWDSVQKKESAELVWVSRSQADQRKGRTGRTCDGDVFRLVTGSFYSKLEDFEPPSILNLSLRLQVLHMCCAQSKAINEPKLLLQKALDPPDPSVVQDALDMLVHIGALEKSARNRYEPTFYGQLLACFSLSLDASILILKFGSLGLLREGILLGIMLDIQPPPISRPFGKEFLFMEFISNFYAGDNKSTGLTGKKELLTMGSFCAFQFWQHTFRDYYRLKRLMRVCNFSQNEDLETMLPKMEEEWCSLHNLVQSALQQVEAAYDETLSTLHRFRPKFLVSSDGLPYYCDPYQFQHTCMVDGLTDDDPLDHDYEERKCTAVPFLAPNHFQANDIAKKFSTTVKELKFQLAEDASGKIPSDAYVNAYHDEASICKYFARGLCNRGNQCKFDHVLPSPEYKPVCKFFLSLQGCRNGSSCTFSHDSGPSVSLANDLSLCSPGNEYADVGHLLQYFPPSSKGCVLLVDDTDFHFTSHLINYYNPSNIITTSCEEYDSNKHPSLGSVKTLLDHSDQYQTIISGGGNCRVPWGAVMCVLWFPSINSENWGAYKHRLQRFFEYLAIRMLADSLLSVQVILTMNNLRFSQLQVEKVARESFFFLKESFPYSERNLGVLSDDISTKKPMVVAKPFSYVFNLLPPTNAACGDSITYLYHNLRILEAQR